MSNMLLNEQEQTQKTVMNVLFDKDEISWKNLIFTLIETNQMDPWDIDISKIAVEFIKMLKKLNELNFHISGKVVLASAILLKLKSRKFIEDDIAALDNLINSQYNEEESILEDSPIIEDRKEREIPSRLIPKTPQPRKKKVSVYDLINALEKAIEVEVRRKSIIEITRKPSIKIKISEKDISDIMDELYTVIKNYYAKNDEILTFDKLLPTNSKEDKVMTFVPLLHLDFQGRIDMIQKQHFGIINIRLMGE